MGLSFSALRGLWRIYGGHRAPGLEPLADLRISSPAALLAGDANQAIGY